MLCISITTRPSPPPHPPHRLTASPLPGRPSRGSTTTRQQRWKSTRPPAPSMRARSRARCGLWSSVRRSGPPSRHSTARLSPGGGGGPVGGGRGWWLHSAKMQVVVAQRPPSVRLVVYECI
jgi:hypothetical protein